MRKELEIIYKNTSDLIPYINNSRIHSDGQINQIAASIREFGFANPILVDKDNNVIAGHCRVKAAQKLGINLVPTIVLENLTDLQRKAYVIADNKLALNADWDNDLLSLELSQLQSNGFDVSLTGFDDIANDFMPASEDEQGKLDELSPIYVTCPKCGHEFNSRES